MKNQTLFFLTITIVAFLASAFNCASETSKTENDPTGIEIGVVDGNAYVITFDLPAMKSQWEAILAENGIATDLSGFAIIHEEEDDQYLLVAFDAGNLVNTAMPLQLLEGVFTELPVGGGGVTVTCTGCTEGCNPRINPNGNGYCQFPCPNCVKTETLNPGGTNLTN